MPPVVASSGGPPRALATTLSRAFLTCAQPAATYGACLRAAVDTELAQGACGQSFQLLRECIQKNIKAAK